MSAHATSGKFASAPTRSSPRLAGSKMIDRVTQLEARLGLSFSDRRLALVALTHTSYLNEHRDQGLMDNQRLEFLGDAAIDLAVSQRLMERFPEASEGELTKLRASVVSEEGLFEVASSARLGELLLLGRGEEAMGGRKRPSILADALEAVIAALFLDGGLDEVLAFVDRWFQPTIDRAALENRDYKSQLQTLAQATLGDAPHYRVVSESGPAHEKIFLVELTIGEVSYASGEGRSKKAAEQLAARMALEALESGG